MQRYSQSWWDGFAKAFCEPDRHVPRGIVSAALPIETVAVGFDLDTLCPRLGWKVDGGVIPAEFSGEPMLVDFGFSSLEMGES